MSDGLAKRNDRKNSVVTRNVSKVDGITEAKINVIKWGGSGKKSVFLFPTQSDFYVSSRDSIVVYFRYKIWRAAERPPLEIPTDVE